MNLSDLRASLGQKAKSWADALRIGRTPSWPTNYEELHRQYGSNIALAVRSFSKVPANEADLHQWVWEKLLQSRLLDRYAEYVRTPAGHGAPFKSYLLRAVYNHACNFVRYKGRREKERLHDDFYDIRNELARYPYPIPWEEILVDPKPTYDSDEVTEEKARALIESAMQVLTDEQRQAIETGWGVGKGGLRSKLLGTDRHLVEAVAMKKMAEWIEGLPVVERDRKQIIDYLLSTIGIDTSVVWP